MPEEVETTFLNQTIKVFTKVNINKNCILNLFKCIFCVHDLFFFCSLQIDPASEKNESLFPTLKAILSTILHELCDKAAQENEDP